MHIKRFKIQLGDITFYGDQLTKWEGLQEIVTEYELAKNALGNGSIVMGRYMPQREIEIEARIDRKKADATLRYFKANRDIKLQIERRTATVVCQRAELDWRHGMYTNPWIVLNLIAADPFFYDVSDFGRNIAKVMPRFGFPWTFSPQDPVSFGYRAFSDKTVFVNDGDEKVGIKLKIEAKGTVQNVKIENLKTKEFLRVVQTLNVGDVLELSTVGGDSYIRHNGKDIFDQIDRLSDFFKLDPGDNFLQYSADGGATDMDIYLYYRPKYLAGVEDIEL